MTALPSTTPLPPQSLSIIPTLYNEVRPEWLPGVVGDDSVAIQNAINWVLQKGSTGYDRGGTVLLSCKLYTLKSPLIIYQPGGYAVCITLKGPFKADIVGGAATLQFPFNDKPGIIIQTGRTVTLENLNLVGTNNFYATASVVENLPLDSSYIVPGISTGRYRPYAAISIDSFESTIAPADQYPGLSQLYKNVPGGGSKKVTIKGCAIQNWLVGVMLNSSNANAQGDGCQIHDNIFNCCTTAIAVGQSQARGLDIGYNEYNFIKVLFDWSTYGQQNGTPPSVSGGLASNVKYLCMGSTTQIGSFSLRNFYGELICSLGMLSSNSHPNNMASVFDNLQVSFAKTTAQAEAHLITGGNAKFVGGWLRSEGEGSLYFHTLQAGNGPVIEFDNIDLRTQNPNAESQIYVNDVNCVRYHNATTIDRIYNAKVSGVRFPLDDETAAANSIQPRQQVVMPLVAGNNTITFDGKGGAKLAIANTNFKIGDIVREAAALNKYLPLKVQGFPVSGMGCEKVGVIGSIDDKGSAVLFEVPPFFSGNCSMNLEVVRMGRN